MPGWFRKRVRFHNGEGFNIEKDEAIIVIFGITPLAKEKGLARNRVWQAPGIRFHSVHLGAVSTESRIQVLPVFQAAPLADLFPRK